VTKAQIEIWATEESESMTPMEALDAEMDSLNEQIALLEDKPTLTSNEEAKLAQLEDTLAELSDKYQQLQAAEVNVLMSDSAPLNNKN
jgi:chromosome segregation ATPase